MALQRHRKKQHRHIYFINLQSINIICLQRNFNFLLFFVSAKEPRNVSMYLDNTGNIPITYLIGKYTCTKI